MLEESIGGTSVTNTGTNDDGNVFPINETETSKWYDQVTGDVTSQYHRYQVTYSAFEPIGSEGSNRYSTVVTNRRLGNIDITVNKVWNSGDNGEELQALKEALDNTDMSLALKLDFHESMDADANDYFIGTVDGEEGEYVRLGNESSGAEEVPIYNVERSVGEEYTSDTAFNGEPIGKSVVKIDLPNNAGGESGVPKSQTYYFNNLPKYDVDGTIVRYTVVEGLLDNYGKFWTLEEYKNNQDNKDTELYKALSKWAMSMRETEYISANDPENVLIDRGDKDVDFQTFDATNTLTGTKSVEWFKEWNDAYRHSEGERPDIYLDIFREVHYINNEGNEATRLELYQKDYHWTATPAGEGEDPEDAVNNWTATIENVPQYDSLGYEITYYAVERAEGDTLAFDYAPPNYLVRDEKENFKLIGNRESISDKYSDNEKSYVYELKGEDGNYISVVESGSSSTIRLDERYNDPNRPINYALAEHGKFENTLQANPNLAGTKLWQNVPGDFPVEQLPQVTFALYQEELGVPAAGEDATPDPDESQSPETEEPVATLKVNWENTSATTLSSSITTNFRFFLEGNWEMEVERGENGAITYVYTSLDEGSPAVVRVNSEWEVIDGQGNPADLPESVRLLPQYSPEGYRYSYTMEEQSVTLVNDEGEEITILLDPETGTPQAASEGGNTEEGIVLYNSIFSRAKFADNSFQATNVYNDQQEGQLAVEKWINVGKMADGEKYPAIQVDLYRATPSTLMEEHDDAWVKVDSLIWEPDDVNDAFIPSEGEEKPQWGHLEDKFDNLLIYAPNGEKFLYKAVEVKETDEGEFFLSGYETWAVKDAFEESSDFIDHLGDTAGTGQSGDGVPSTILKGEAVVGLNATAVEEGGENPALDTATFINRRESEGVTLQGTKFWNDWKNNEFRPDDVSSVKLTVKRHAENQPGQDNAIPEVTLEDDDYTVEWTMDGVTWTFTISGKGEVGLDQYAPNGMPWIYTVTEKEKVEPYVGSGSITFDASQANEDGVVVAADTAKLTNSLKKNVSFTKHWQNEDNEAIEEDYLGTVTITFVLQVKEQGETNWQDASAYFTDDNKYWDEGEAPEFTQAKQTSLLNGFTGSFQDLPIAIKNDEGGSPEYVLLDYRVMETEITYTDPADPSNNKITVLVEVDDDGAYTFQGEGSDSIFGLPQGTVSGNTTTITNTLKTVKLQITKNWEGDSGNLFGTRPEDEAGNWEVTFLIQYSDEPQGGSTREWKPYVVNDKLQTVTLSDTNDKASQTTTVGDLPAFDGRQYRAVELNPLGGSDTDYTKDNVNRYIRDGSEGETSFHIGYEVSYGGENPVVQETPDADDPDYITTATNTLETVEVAAQKEWIPGNLEVGEQYPSVELKVQYKGEDETWIDLSGSTVTMDGTVDSEDTTAPIAYEDVAWQAIWKNLPKYLPDSAGYGSGEETEYRVVEIPGDGYIQVEWDEESGQWEPVDNNDRNNPQDSINQEFIITNMPVIDFTVVKEWDQPPEGYASWTVTVQLYRTTGEGYPVAEMSEVGGPVILASEEEWTYTWNNLPKYDTGGNKYNYYARELSIQTGSETNFLTEQGTISAGGEEFAVGYEDEDAQTTITNRPVGTCSVEKVWWNTGVDTPQKITVGLYQKEPDGTETPVSLLGKAVQVTLDSGNKWSHTWDDLYKYDQDGKAIIYVVRELDDAGDPIKDGGTVTFDGNKYTVYYEGTEIHNVLHDDLAIEKRLAGTAAEPDRIFTFTIAFEYPDGMRGIPEEYSYTVSKIEVDSEGAGSLEEPEPTERTIPSDSGKIQLKGGEKAVITGLPAGTAYTVTELEANQDGYTTTIIGGDENNSENATAEGTITLAQDDEDHVIFTNCRALGSLIIQKQVSGGGGDRNKEWTFHLTCDLPEEILLLGEVDCYRNGSPEKQKLVFDPVNGYATFTLRSGEILEIQDLPNGTKFNVTEVEAGQDGYTTTVIGTGTVLQENGRQNGMEGTIDSQGPNLVAFTNDKPGGGIVPTPTPTLTPNPSESPSPEPSGSPTPSPNPSETPSPTPEPSGSPGPGSSETPTPTTDITPTPAPSETPPGGDTPDDTPQTGDPTHTLWWALAGIVALVGLGILWLTRPKNKNARHMKK